MNWQYMPISRHRPASRAEAAVIRTWLPAEVSRELRSEGHTGMWQVHGQTTFFAKSSRTILRAPRINPSSTHWCSSGRCVESDGVNTILTYVHYAGEGSVQRVAINVPARITFKKRELSAPRQRQRAAAMGYRGVPRAVGPIRGQPRCRQLARARASVVAAWGVPWSCTAVQVLATGAARQKSFNSRILTLCACANRRGGGRNLARMA